MDKALIFDIQGFSVHDGPGSRTLIFFSGCPLRCTWCSNPEGQELKQKIMFSSKKCKHGKYRCRRCVDICPHNAVAITEDAESDELLVFDRGRCDMCDTFECVRVCHEGAIRLSGEWMTVSEIMEVVKRDRSYWPDGGGVTFSGGEAFMQHEFLSRLARACKQEKIHTAIETTAYADQAIFLETMRYIDFAFIDVKHMDTVKHTDKTGVGNEKILGNISGLAKPDWKGRLILRMPVIRGFNDDDANIEATADFMDALGLFEINILPFHRLGDSKYTQLGEHYEYSDEKPTSAGTLERIQDIFLAREIACYVAEEVLY